VALPPEKTLVLAFDDAIAITTERLKVFDIGDLDNASPNSDRTAASNFG
jgi:hypothetical protein